MIILYSLIIALYCPLYCAQNLVNKNKKNPRLSCRKVPFLIVCLHRTTTKYASNHQDY